MSDNLSRKYNFSLFEDHTAREQNGRDGQGRGRRTYSSENERRNANRSQQNRNTYVAGQGTPANNGRRENTANRGRGYEQSSYGRSTYTQSYGNAERAPQHSAPRRQAQIEDFPSEVAENVRKGRLNKMNRKVFIGIVTGIILAVICCYLIFCHVRVAELTNQIGETTEQLILAQDQYEQYQLKAETDQAGVNLDQKAKQLGLQAPGAGQTEYVKIEVADKGTVVDGSGSGNWFVDALNYIIRVFS